MVSNPFELKFANFISSDYVEKLDNRMYKILNIFYYLSNYFRFFYKLQNVVRRNVYV